MPTTGIGAATSCLRAVAVWLVLLSSAAAQGFDCTKAAGSLERLICSDQDLATLDRALAARYAELRSGLTPEGVAVLRDSQRAWLATRKECMTGGAAAATCLGGRYTDRTNQLDAAYKTAGNLAIEARAINRREPRWRVIEADSFPWMVGAPPARADAFNRYIGQRLKLAKGMFAASGMRLDARPSGDTTFDRSYAVHRFDGRLISLEIFQMHASYFGHGWHQEYAINWDLRRDRPLRLADVFRSGIDWRQRVYALAMQHIHEAGELQDPESAFDPSAVDDDDAWLFDDDGAVLLLGHGERSMVGVSVDVAIPYDELRPFLRADAPVTIR